MVVESHILRLELEDALYNLNLIRSTTIGPIICHKKREEQNSNYIRCEPFHNEYCPFNVVTTARTIATTSKCISPMINRNTTAVFTGCDNRLAIQIWLKSFYINFGMVSAIVVANELILIIPILVSTLVFQIKNLAFAKIWRHL